MPAAKRNTSPPGRRLEAGPRKGVIDPISVERDDAGMSRLLDDNAFSHLEPRRDRTHDHVLHDVCIPKANPKPVVLHLKFCGKGSPYWNALMKLKPLADVTAATKRAAGLFARLGVQGWSNVLEDGKPVPYSEELGVEVFDALIDVNRSEKVDAAIAVAMNPDNFADGPQPDIDDLGKG